MHIIILTCDAFFCLAGIEDVEVPEGSIPQPNFLAGASPGTSASGSGNRVSSPPVETPSMEELREKRLAYLDRQEQANTEVSQSDSIDSTETDDCQEPEPELEITERRRPASE